MDNYSKLMFYYEPGKHGNKYTRSYTLSFSRINTETNTYKQKAILQHWSDKRNTLEEYKLKEVHIGADSLLQRIARIDFNKKYTTPVNEDDEKLYIYYGDKKIVTSNLGELKDVLEDFHFLELCSITHKHYQYIKDMDEYIKMRDILTKQAKTLTDEEKVDLMFLFRQENPYKTFQNISNLRNYIQFMKKVQ